MNADAPLTQDLVDDPDFPLDEIALGIEEGELDALLALDDPSHPELDAGHPDLRAGAVVERVDPRPRETIEDEEWMEVLIDREPLD